MNFQTVIEHALFLSNKEQSGNSISPDEISVAAQMASTEMLKKLTGIEEEYRPGMPIARMSAEVTQANMHYLELLKVDLGTDLPALIVNSDGLATIPDNCYYILGVSTFSMSGTTAKEKPVDIVNEQKWKARLDNRLFNNVVSKYPYCRLRNRTLEFRPKNIGVAKMSYIKYPDDPFYDYYIDANMQYKYLEPGVSYTLQANEVYRDGTVAGTVTSISQPFQFPESLYPNLSNIILGYMATDLRDQFLKQVAESRKDKGQ